MGSSRRPALYDLEASVTACSPAGGDTLDTVGPNRNLHSNFRLNLHPSLHPNPYLLILTHSLTFCNLDPKVEIKTGFRSIRYDANQGFFLNEQHFKAPNQ